jgi:histone H3/H4
MSDQERHIAFIDILGLRNALASGRLEAAESKILRLASLVESIVNRFPNVSAHGATDFFIMWSAEPNTGWDVVNAAISLFQEYFDLNKEENITDINDAYLIRAGLAFGEVKKFASSKHNVSYYLTLGDGIARAYETQAMGPGMRLFIDLRSIQQFKPIRLPEGDYQYAKIDKVHETTGKISSREIRWVGENSEAVIRLPIAARLFRKALIEHKKARVQERVILHYQQTLCAVLKGITDINVLIPYLSYRFNARRYYKYLFPIWTTAWLNLFRTENEEQLRDLREILWEKFLMISGTDGMPLLAKYMNTYNRWRPLIRFLKEGKLRMRPRNRKSRSPIGSR